MRGNAVGRRREGPEPGEFDPPESLDLRPGVGPGDGGAGGVREAGGGYYMLASGAIAFQNLPENAARKLPRHPVPVVLPARLAVDAQAQDQGLRENLLLDALGRCLGPADRLGVHAVEVDAIDPQAAAFYRK